MPSPPKDRPSGRLGRLLAVLRPSHTGPLPVQTGFPTSLADLVVKNHGRLRKPSPSSKRGKRGATPSPFPLPSPPPASPPPPPPAAAVPPSDRARPGLPPDQAVCRSKGGGFGLGLGFLALGGVASLALLVIWSKKVVAAVTVASFSLFLLESVRSSYLPRRQRPQPAVAEMQLYLEGRGRVSPIREMEAEAEPSSRPICWDSDRGTEASVSSISEILDESSSPKAKTKKRSWKKLIANAKKLHKGRKCREADSSGSFSSEGDHADAPVGGDAKPAGPSDSCRGMANQKDVAVEDAVAREEDSFGSRRCSGIEIDAKPVEIDASVEEVKAAGLRFPALILVAVVLVGLVAGKLPAVAFTMLCSVLLGSVQRLRSGGGGLQGMRFMS